ncbi:AAA domain-containing protein, putative AbiEii toxin, Type IV TA system [Flavobacterium fluvii]|uniref:AAA domain-containing protein, putative AbiEii toxin, Type IV TA system n=1 Tax=Flavobacterium fluvii TaxID=468056 RepID=A0A1M5H703_9FLAO|nr:DUF4435 domain-containing protein [Flavobacterium fluvii]SHG11673.1 AAA domain-containing protein, putative AbiEii toxin, Type IV TA system [Flavobacterium fluvii]
MSYNIIFPKKDGTSGQEVIQTESNIVLIGANGAGKTRFGVYVEQLVSSNMNVHRISAQKALNIPEFAPIKNLEQAENALKFGNADYPTLQYKTTFRWGKDPATFLLNDYEKLLSLLFAKSSERDRIHTQQTRQTQTYISVPNSPIDIIIKIWNSLLPHRNISFNDGKITVSTSSGDNYHGKDMSDGERVILYLIGQCLCAPSNSIIIVDEPEIHIHKSLVDKLWNKIEELSQDKLIIYITHDLEFATSRTDASKFWIKEYNGKNRWLWQEIPSDDNIPESLMLEIIGNRKNVIFCEGEMGKLDSTIYQLVYPNFHIISRGGGSKVIEATKAFRENTELHHLTAFGIIDSDYKEQEEITILRKHGIFTISVAEVENLFCIEPLIRIISNHLHLDADIKVNEVINFLIDALSTEFNTQVSSKAEKIIEYKLGAFSKESNSEQGLVDGFNTTIGRINIPLAYETARVQYQSAIDNRDIEQLLLLYNRKSLPNRISSIFGLTNGEYGKLLVRLLKGNQQNEIITALKNYLPKLE